MNHMSLGQRLWWGARTGSIFGAMFVALAVLAFLLGGEETFEKLDTSLRGVALAYMVGGLGGGLITGALLPLTKRLVGAAFIGYVAFIPVGIMVVLVRSTRESFASGAVLTLVVALIGIPVAVNSHRRSAEDRPRQSRVANDLRDRT